MEKRILDNHLVESHDSSKFNPRFVIVLGIIVLAAISRFLPHPPNFTPLGGMALFGAAYFTKKYWAYLAPFAALWVSDLILNNVVYAQYHEGFTILPSYAIWTYVAFGAMILMGSKVIKKINIPTVAGASIAASLLFFLITNFGAWFADPFNMFADDLSGLVAAFAAGLPFLLNTMAGDLVYAGLLFGSFEMMKSVYPQMALKA